ncbi:MAG: hypothetical protein U0528_07085 [Anaerolineae bacterium]
MQHRRRGYQTGQAYLREDAAIEGTPLLVVNAAPNGGNGSKRSLTIGDKVAVPDGAVVLSKFPTKKNDVAFAPGKSSPLKPIF